MNEKDFENYLGGLSSTPPSDVSNVLGPTKEEAKRILDEIPRTDLKVDERLDEAKKANETIDALKRELQIMQKAEAGSAEANV